jgi:hypothetical protein
MRIENSFAFFFAKKLFLTFNLKTKRKHYA